MSVALRSKLLAAWAVIVVVLLTLSAIGPKQTYTGYHADDNHKVRTVEAGSPAASAGLEVGDILKTVNDTSVTDTQAFQTLPRPAAGTTWPYVVERTGQIVHLEILQAPLPQRDDYFALARTVEVLSIFGFILWTYLSAPGTPATLLAVSGLSWGSAAGLPQPESPAGLFVVGTLALLLMFLGVAAILHFLLVFPSPLRFMRRPSSTKILYAPLVVVVSADMVLIMLQRGLNLAVGMSVNLFLSLYFLAAIVMLVWRYATASAAGRAAHGLGLILASVVIVFGPFLVWPIVTGIWPVIGEFAYSPYHPILNLVTLPLIPIAFSIAAVRSARSSQAG